MARLWVRRMMLAVGVLLGSEAVALAQNFGVPSVPSMGAMGGVPSVPFGSTYRRPAVSPYMMMSVGGIGSMSGLGGSGSLGGGGAFNPLIYQQLIQPREQQEFQSVTQMQQGRQLNTLQNRVQQIQQGTLGRQVSGQIRATGHGATYLNTSHYYGGR